MKSLTEIARLLGSSDEASKIDFLAEVCKTPPKFSEAVVLLGCDTEQALHRADIAANYYRKGYTNLIIASGGVEREYKGERKAECHIMSERLVASGVPQDRIINDMQARTTIGNMVYSLGILCGMGCLDNDFKSLTIITEPYHLRRSLMLARTYFPEFIEISGYTEGWQEQFEQYQYNEVVKHRVQTEFELIKQLIENGKIKNFS